MDTWTLLLNKNIIYNYFLGIFIYDVPNRVISDHYFNPILKLVNLVISQNTQQLWIPLLTCKVMHFHLFNNKKHLFVSIEIKLKMVMDTIEIKRYS